MACLGVLPVQEDGSDGGKPVFAWRGSGYFATPLFNIIYIMRTMSFDAIAPHRHVIPGGTPVDARGLSPCRLFNPALYPLIHVRFVKRNSEKNEDNSVFAPATRDIDANVSHAVPTVHTETCASLETNPHLTDNARARTSVANPAGVLIQVNTCICWLATMRSDTSPYDKGSTWDTLRKPYLTTITR